MGKTIFNWDAYVSFERIHIGKPILGEKLGLPFGILDLQVHTEDEVSEILKKYVAVDFGGDMRQLRQAIIHHKGVATPEFDNMKLLTWFNPGDPVNLDFEKMEVIFGIMADFRNFLHKLSLPPSDAKFPS